MLKLAKMSCPWGKLNIIYGGAYCTFFTGRKSPCPYSERGFFYEPHIDVLDTEVSCPRVKRFVEVLSGCLHKRVGKLSDPEMRFLHQKFCVAVNIKYLDDLLYSSLTTNYEFFAVKLGKWLSLKCSQDTSCPYKALIP